MTEAPPIANTQNLEDETIAFWMEIAVTLGFPRSVGEVYGLIFISELPLNADDIVSKRGMSRSGAGQTLKLLADIGAIRTTLSSHSRKEHYELQTDLGVLVRLFLNSRVLPRVEELARRQTTLAAQASATGNTHLIARFNKVERWQTKTAPLIALVKSLATTA
ncbi:MAG: transcriptional regulator [Verrucomicrobia bacterium]|nr:transcriptional regulator [Verrucomicrobiota bacterium]